MLLELLTENGIVKKEPSYEKCCYFFFNFIFFASRHIPQNNLNTLDYHHKELI